jgi:hypothetical protein
MLRTRQQFCSSTNNCEFFKYISDPFYHTGERPQYPLTGRLCASLSLSGCSAEKRKSLPLSGSEPRFLELPGRSIVIMPNTLWELPAVSVPPTLISCDFRFRALSASRFDIFPAIPCELQSPFSAWVSQTDGASRYINISLVVMVELKSVVLSSGTCDGTVI